MVQKYGYDSAHHLTGITDNATGAKLWEAKTYNAQGLIATENGVGGRQTTYTYDQAGRPLTMSNNLASFTYTYNGGGQLTKRVENFGTSGLTETFAYDAGGCLTSSTLQGKTPVTVSYNSGRGITNKSDVGTYSYTSNGAPLATVSPVSGYNPSAQSITYNSSNLPASITQGGFTRTYTYDVNDQRDYSVLTKSNSSLPFAAGKRYYFGDFERNINTENNVVTDIDYIFADGRLVALIKTVGGTKTTYGAMTDRQGSLRALYNGSGLVQSFSYDAWGNRRNPSTGVALTTSELVAANSITSRGYTCHEHMDEFGLINMNARIYDPALGMFISVDPLAQEYYNTYPYAYCGGDPVNNVDPMGEDYWSTSNTDEIYAFWKWYNRNGGQSEFDFNEAGWNHMTDEEFKNALETSTMTYNDKTRILYMSNSKVENGELVIIGTRLILPEPRSYKTILEEMIPFFGTASDAASELFYSETYGTWLGKDGKLRKMRVNGNQYTGGKIKYAKKWSYRYGYISKFAIGYTLKDIWDGYKDGQNSFEGAMLDTVVEILPLPFPFDMWFDFWYEMGKIYGPLSANDKESK